MQVDGIALASENSRIWIEEGRWAVVGQPIAYAETGDEYILFENVGFTLDQTVRNLGHQVKDYLFITPGIVYWRQTPVFEKYLKSVFEDGKVLKIWKGSCRLVATERLPDNQYRLKEEAA